MFPSLPLAPINPLDLALLAAAVLWPAYDTWRDYRDKSAGLKRPLLEQYRATIIVLWLFTILVLTAWAVSGRSLADLGLRADTGWPFLLASALAVVASALYAAQYFVVRNSEKARAQLVDLLRRQTGVSEVLPQSAAERGAFRLVAITAGVCEEIIYRGFLFWAFAHWMPVWLAAVVVLAIFVLAHLYQRSASALAGVAAAGAVATGLVMLGGSLLPAILLHVVVDLAGGEMTELAREEARRQEAG